MCSGSWDCRINLWQTESNEGDVVSLKKRKKGSEEEESQSEVFFICQLLVGCESHDIPLYVAFTIVESIVVKGMSRLRDALGI